MGGERDDVHRPGRDEREVRAEQDEMEHAASVAQHAVRQDLHQVERRQVAQHPPAQRDQPAVLEHAYLAPVLGLDVRRRLLERKRLRLEDCAAAALHHQVRQREIVAEARVDLDVVASPHRVDRTVPARHRAEPRLALAQLQLVAPVGALLVRAFRGFEPQLAAHVRDVGVREVAHEPAQGERRPHGVGIGECDHVTARLANREVLSRDLASPWRAEQPDARLVLRDTRDGVVGRIGRRVGRDDDLELVGRVVELEQVLEPAFDHALLVVRRNDHGHGRELAALTDGARAQARGERGGGGVPDMGPRKRAERRPEEQLHDDHSNRANRSQSAVSPSPRSNETGGS